MAFVSIPTPLTRPTLLIVGCGDVGMRVARLLRGRWRLVVLTTDSGRVPALRAAGICPLLGDLDRPETLARLAYLADAVLHLAPPAATGATDVRTAKLLRALARGGRVQRIVYVSTSGVYGDCAGDRVDETRPLRPATERAQRRVDAEARLRWYGRAFGARVSLLRVPGIYAADRAGGHPRERLARATPVLAAADDVYTNHIHADDLARACIAALFRGRPQRAVNVCDDGEAKTGDHYDLVADLSGLPRPPRITRAEALTLLTPMQRSFLAESRRLDNTRMKRELRLVLRYPSVDVALDALARAVTRPASA